MESMIPGRDRQEEEAKKAAGEKIADWQKNTKNKGKFGTRQKIKKAVILSCLKVGAVLGSSMVALTIVGQAIGLFDSGGGRRIWSGLYSCWRR